MTCHSLVVSRIFSAGLFISSSWTSKSEVSFLSEAEAGIEEVEPDFEIVEVGLVRVLTGGFALDEVAVDDLLLGSVGGGFRLIDRERFGFAPVAADSSDPLCGVLK